MAAPTFSNNSPTGDYESFDVVIIVKISHGTGVDEDTINVTLTGPLDASATSVVTNGVFNTAAGYNGDIKASGTNAEVVIRSHDWLMPGEWTVAVNADSDDGGEVGSTSWTFKIGSELTGVLLGMKDLLEGKEGVGRTIPQNTFRHYNVKDGDEAMLNPAGKVRPFLLSVVGPAEAQDNPGNVSGDYVWGAHTIRLSILYFVQDNQAFELDLTMADHEKRIRQVLEWPRNFHLFEGWCGCEIANGAVEEVSLGENDSVDLLIRHYDILVQTRELHE
jgi:hypothetical protein